MVVHKLLRRGTGQDTPCAPSAAPRGHFHMRKAIARTALPGSDKPAPHPAPLPARPDKYHMPQRLPTMRPMGTSPCGASPPCSTMLTRSGGTSTSGGMPLPTPPK